MQPDSFRSLIGAVTTYLENIRPRREHFHKVHDVQLHRGRPRSHTAPVLRSKRVVYQLGPVMHDPCDDRLLRIPCRQDHDHELPFAPPDPAAGKQIPFGIRIKRSRTTEISRLKLKMTIVGSLLQPCPKIPEVLLMKIEQGIDLPEPFLDLRVARTPQKIPIMTRNIRHADQSVRQMGHHQIRVAITYFLCRAYRLA